MESSERQAETGSVLREPHLVVAFWGWFVGGTAAFVVLSSTIGTLDTGASRIVAIAWWCMAPVYAVFATVKVWRAGSRAGVLARWSSRLVVLGVYGLPVLLTVSEPVLEAHDHPRLELYVGLESALPAREALGAACHEGRLVAGADAVTFGLGAPESYTTKYSHGVWVRVEPGGVATVTVRYKTISRPRLLGGREVVVRDGDELVLRGACARGVVTWSVGGTVDARYWPRIWWVGPQRRISSFGVGG